MVNSPVKRSGSIVGTKHNDSSWIENGLSILSKDATKWTSPISKTVYSRKIPFQSRANTIAVFSEKDMEAARRKVKENQKIVVAPKCCKECDRLKKENDNLVSENETLKDGIMTKGRENYRLRNDLRVMIDRAQGYHDELETTNELVENLEDSRKNDMMLAQERENALQIQVKDLLAAQNQTVTALKKAQALVAALQMQAAQLQEENERMNAMIEDSKARGLNATMALYDLVRESDRVINLVNKMK